MRSTRPSSFVVGGIIGAILLLAVFDWALIVVSSLIGAHLIQSAIVLPPTGSTLVFIGLAILGIFVQAAVPAERRGIGVYRFLLTNRNAIKESLMNSPENWITRREHHFREFSPLGICFRLINQAQVTVGTHTIPMGLSWIALIVAAILCIWMWRLSITIRDVTRIPNHSPTRRSLGGSGSLSKPIRWRIDIGSIQFRD